MKRILFYYPSNKRSNQIETTLIRLKKLGHMVSLLSTSEKGALHQFLEANDIPTENHSLNQSNSAIYYLKQIVFLVRYSRENKVDLIFSNLQHANFIAIWAQFFVKAKVIAFRHHYKFTGNEYGIELKINRNEKRFDWWINHLAKTIVLPSKGIRDNILRSETVNPNKLKVIPYLYDLSEFSQPKESEINEIKGKYPATLRLAMISRLIPFKRHYLLLPVFKKYIHAGADLKVLILDEGPEKKRIQKYVEQNNLDKHIFLLGYVKNPLAYMKSADLIVHPSITEASNNMVKEAGLMETTVAVCTEVGDFNEYLKDGINAFKLKLSKPEDSLDTLLAALIIDKSRLSHMGKALKESVLEVFGNNEIALKAYEDLIADR